MRWLWKKLNLWILAILQIAALLVSVQLLRQNNLQMIVLRNAVVDADASGNKTATAKSISNLQKFVTTHTNASLGPNGVALQKTYQAAYERAVQQSISGDTLGHQLYDQADAACQPVFRQTHSFPDYTQCVASKLSSLAAHDPLGSAKVPSADLYRYNFISPLWAPDAAGWSILVSLAIFALIAFKVLTGFGFIAIIWWHKLRKN